MAGEPGHGRDSGGGYGNHEDRLLQRTSIKSINAAAALSMGTKPNLTVPVVLTIRSMASTSACNSRALLYCFRIRSLDNARTPSDRPGRKS